MGQTNFIYSVPVGAELLMQKLQKFQPKITVFNGKGIYEVFNACFGELCDNNRAENGITFAVCLNMQLVYSTFTVYLS